MVDTCRRKVRDAMQSPSFPVTSKAPKLAFLPRGMAFSSLSSLAPYLARGRGGVSTARWGWLDGLECLFFGQCDATQAGQGLGRAFPELSTGLTTARGDKKTRNRVGLEGPRWPDQERGKLAISSSPVLCSAGECATLRPSRKGRGFGSPVVQALSRSRAHCLVRGFFVCAAQHALRWAVWGLPQGGAGSFTRSSNPARSATLVWKLGRQVHNLL